MTAAPDLALYYYDTCGYCMRVRYALKKLDVEVEMRNIHRDPKHLDDLAEARGRETVPVLRIAHPDGDEWMGESQDIVAYLEKRFALG